MSATNHVISIIWIIIIDVSNETTPGLDGAPRPVLKAILPCRPGVALAGQAGAPHGLPCEPARLELPANLSRLAAAAVQPGPGRRALPLADDLLFGPNERHPGVAARRTARSRVAPSGGRTQRCPPRAPVPLGCRVPSAPQRPQTRPNSYHAQTPPAAWSPAGVVPFGAPPSRSLAHSPPAVTTDRSTTVAAPRRLEKALHGQAFRRSSLNHHSILPASRPVPRAIHPSTAPRGPA